MNLGAETVDPEETLFGDVPQRAFAELGVGVDQKLDAQHISLPAQNATWSPPLSSRISRASSGLATERPSPSMIWRAARTCSALLLASLPGPDQSESSSPTRTLPPIAAAIAAIGSWLRPAPSTDHLYRAPKRRSAVRFICMTSSGCGPIPPRMPNTVWTNSGGLTRPRSRK